MKHDGRVSDSRYMHCKNGENKYIPVLALNTRSNKHYRNCYAVKIHSTCGIRLLCFAADTVLMNYKGTVLL